MSTHHRLAAAALALAAVGAPAALAQPEAGSSRLFPLQAEVHAERPGLARLPLPADVLVAVRPDLSDLRVFDAAGREIPFRVDSDARAGAGAAVERAEARVLDVERQRSQGAAGEPPWVRESYLLAAPQPAPEGSRWELVVESAAPRFVRRIVLGPEPSAPLFRLSAATERTRAALPAQTGGELRVVITGAESFFLEPAFRFESTRTPPAPERLEIPLQELARGRTEGVSRLELARPRGVAPDALRLTTSSASFVRAVRVIDLRPGAADVALGAGEVFRLGDVEHLEVAIAGATGDRLRIEVLDQDSPPLAELGVTGVVRRPALVLPLEGGAPAAWLRFGGGRAFRPRYDLARFGDGGPAPEAWDPSRLASARLGAIEPNPLYDAAPALAFAMHPAAAADAAPFEWRRALRVEPSAEGLARLRLAPEDLARLRADLADLRLVDPEGRQWPFLIERDAARVALRAEVSRDGEAAGQSRYRIVPESGPVPTQALLLEAAAPYFERAFRLEDGKGQAIASGRLRKDALRPAPVAIPLGGARVETLVLFVADGDDAPLALTSAQLEVAVPDLYAAAPAGEYWLLLGHPEASAPRYELASVRDLVFGVASSEITAGALEPNPAFRRSARLASGARGRRIFEHGLVWAALLVAVGVLGGITLRIVRREGPPTR